MQDNMKSIYIKTVFLKKKKDPGLRPKPSARYKTKRSDAARRTRTKSRPETPAALQDNAIRKKNNEAD